MLAKRMSYRNYCEDMEVESVLAPSAGVETWFTCGVVESWHSFLESSWKPGGYPCNL